MVHYKKASEAAEAATVGEGYKSAIWSNSAMRRGKGSWNTTAPRRRAVERRP